MSLCETTHSQGPAITCILVQHQG